MSATDILGMLLDLNGRGIKVLITQEGQEFINKKMEEINLNPEAIKIRKEA